MPRPHERSGEGSPINSAQKLPQHSIKPHSTDSIERLNGEIKRRTEVAGIFPNEDAIVRLIMRRPARAERRMYCPACPLPETGNFAL